MDALEFLTLISLFLTPLAVITAAGVVSLWMIGYRQAVETSNMPEVKYLLIGIIIGFSGSVLDNVYWGIAWSLDYIAAPQADWFFDRGPTMNIFFRQAAGIISACFHLVGVSMYARRCLNKAIVTGVLSGFALVLLLVVINNDVY